MMMFKERLADPQGWRTRASSLARPPADAGTTPATLVWCTLCGVLLVLVGPLARHWLAGTLANICVLGGILAAPLLSLIGWLGMVLPGQVVLHQLAPGLVSGALIWFVVAIIGAHAIRLSRRAAR